MPPIYGTNDVLSLLAAQAGSQTVAQFGEDKVYDEVLRSLQAHNRLLADMTRGIARPTTDRLYRWGGTIDFQMQEMDEYGQPDAQRGQTGVNMGNPLRYFGTAVQWTRKAFQRVTVEELTKETRGIQTAHVRSLQKAVKRAYYLPSNLLTYNDKLIDNVVLPIRRLANADSTPIPINPNSGEVFDPATHTHYLFASTLTPAILDSLIETVREHGARGQIVVEIPPKLETAMRAVTGFNATIPVDIQLGGGSTVTIATGNLDKINLENRKIGTYGAADIWVKTWIPCVSAGTCWIQCRDTGTPFLDVRTRDGGFPELSIAYENDSFPLRSRILDSEFGMAVHQRTSAAVAYINSGASVYVSPTEAQL